MKGRDLARTRNIKKQVSKPGPSKLTDEELKKLQQAQQLLLPLKEKYNLTSDELLKLLDQKLSFPAALFVEKLTVLESVVKYLKEEKKLSLRRIAQSLGRDERNIWHVYNAVSKKHPARIKPKNTKLLLPVSILDSTKLSAQEAVVSYLRDEKGLSYHEIATLLRRNDRTIWTVYNRSRKKYVK